MASTSPSRTSRVCGSARTASTTPGSRAVMSSRLRVKIRTVSPSRCTCTRTPSSLWSTSTGSPDFATAVAGSGALAASIGWIRCPPAARPLPAPAGPRATAPRRRRWWTRAASPRAGRPPAALRTRRQAVLDRRLHRALAELAGDQAEQELLLLGGGPGEQGADRLGAGRAGPRSAQLGHGGEGPVDLGDRERRLGSGRWGVLQGPPADAGTPLPQAAGQVGDDDLDVVGRCVPQHLGDAVTFGVARAGRGQRGPSRGQPAEQHEGDSAGGH